MKEKFKQKHPMSKEKYMKMLWIKNLPIYQNALDKTFKYFISLVKNTLIMIIEQHWIKLTQLQWDWKHPEDFGMGSFFYNVFLRISDTGAVNIIPLIKVLFIIILVGYFWQVHLIENDFQRVYFKSGTFVFSCCENFKSWKYLVLKITHDLFSRIIFVQESV